MRHSPFALSIALITTTLSAQVQTQSTHVRVSVVDGVADTQVAMTFRNDGPRPAEKVVVLPLPEGATADKLELEIGGRMHAGEVLEREQARGIYESIVRRRLDPALLEYVGRSTLRLRVFPVPPRGTQRVRIRFRLILPESEGLFAYEFPARAMDGGRFSFEARIESKKPIKNVYSPLSAMDITRNEDHAARLSMESAARPQHDPAFFYALSEKDFGLNLLTYRPEGEDGYFLLMLSPKQKWEEHERLPKAITFVLDTSGSMQGEKIRQARDALRFFLDSLRPQDRFNVIAFSGGTRPFARGPVAASPVQIEKAKKLVASIEARGGTNIEEALRLALEGTPKDDGVPIVVFLTDGLASVGVRDTNQILASCQRANRAGARVFVFGVGNDVNTHLLDALSDKTGGTREYVKPRENLEVKTSALFTKLAHPVMTDLELDFGRADVERLAPRRLPDLFRGSRLVVAGRYKGKGATAVRLRGRLRDRSMQFVHDASFPAVATKHDFVATIWAQRRAGQLLDEIRLHGSNAELVSEVRRLGTEHGILTPYTSGLVVEPGQPVVGGGGRSMRYRGPGSRTPPTSGPTTGGARGVQPPRAGGPSTPAPRTPAKPAVTGSDDFVLGRGLRANSGAAAVRASTKAARLRYLKTLDEKNRTTRRIGKRTFHLVGEVWIDGAFTETMQKNVRKVHAFSEEYFALLRDHPELTRVFALGRALVLVLDGQAIEIVVPAKRPSRKTRRADR